MFVGLNPSCSCKTLNTNLSKGVVAAETCKAAEHELNEIKRYRRRSTESVPMSTGDGHTGGQSPRPSPSLKHAFREPKCEKHPILGGSYNT